MTLDPALLATCVRRAVAATSRDDAAAEEAIERCLQGRLRVDPLSDHSRRLALAMAPLRSLIADEARDRLSKTTVAVLPIAVSNAVAVPARTGPHILIFEGLIETILVSLEMSHALSSMPPALDRVYPSRHFPFQEEELEADDFVMQSLEPESAGLHSA